MDKISGSQSFNCKDFTEVLNGLYRCFEITDKMHKELSLGFK